jgi:hypothetical protein
VAAFWKPRDVYLELAKASRPDATNEARVHVNRWWVSFIVLLVANNLTWLEFGPVYLVVAATLIVALAVIASVHAGRLFTYIGSPSVTYETAPNYGDLTTPAPRIEPSAPGWYNDPSGVAAHQAYWDGGRWTGATRPDPRMFPVAPGAGPEERDRLRTALIVLGIIVTVATVAAAIYYGFQFEEAAREFARSWLI